MWTLYCMAQVENVSIITETQLDGPGLEVGTARAAQPSPGAHLPAFPVLSALLPLSVSLHLRVSW